MMDNPGSFETPTQLPVRRKRERDSSSSPLPSSSLSLAAGISYSHDMQYALLTRYIIRRRQVTITTTHLFIFPYLGIFSVQGLGLRIRNIDGRAVVGGFTEDYLTNRIPSQATDIQIGDIIMAVDSVDTSNPALCPFNKVVKCLQAAASAREKRQGYQQQNLGDDLLQFTHRLTSAAKFQDTITLRIARLVAVPVTAPTRLTVAVGGTEMYDAIANETDVLPEECH
jgi:hypothetical protein